MGTIYLDGICYSSGGGGGASSADQVSLDDTNLSYEADDVQEAFEKVTKSLTYEEYQELTEEEKNNGTIYLITDVNGDGQSFQPVIYSEEEREIGVWINGKPLYEKTLEINRTFNLSNNAWTDIISISNIDIISELSYFFSGISEIGMADGRLRWNYSYSTEYLRAAASTGTTITNPIITIRYTKTTDQPGSGTWTPQGVPAVHYSTDEQVVGTWLDGSTLYQKTINVGTISSDTSVAHGIANLDTIVDYSGFGVYGSSDKAVMPFQNPANATGFGLNYYDATNLYLKKSSGLGSNFSGCYITIRYTKSNT